MRSIDGDLKKVMDELNDARNSYNAINKGKEGGSFMVRDIGDIVYNNSVKPEPYFVEHHGSEFLTTLVAIIHR
jgi:hypothetical protein